MYFYLLVSLWMMKIKYIDKKESNDMSSPVIQFSTKATYNKSTLLIM